MMIELESFKKYQKLKKNKKKIKESKYPDLMKCEDTLKPGNRI